MVPRWGDPRPVAVRGADSRGGASISAAPGSTRQHVRPLPHGAAVHGVAVAKPHGDVHSSQPHVDVYKIEPSLGAGAVYGQSTSVVRPYGDVHSSQPHIDLYRNDPYINGFGR